MGTDTVDTGTAYETDRPAYGMPTDSDPVTDYQMPTDTMMIEYGMPMDSDSDFPITFYGMIEDPDAK